MNSVDYHFDYKELLTSYENYGSNYGFYTFDEGATVKDFFSFIQKYYHTWGSIRIFDKEDISNSQLFSTEYSLDSSISGIYIPIECPDSLLSRHIKSIKRSSSWCTYDFKIFIK